jgi:hypothetical protein
VSAADSFTNARLENLFTYGPERARWLEEWVETFDWNIEAAVLVTPLLWSFLDEYAIRRIADDVAEQYRDHRERTPEGQALLLGDFIERYIDRVKAEAESGTTPAALWSEHALRLDPPMEVAETMPSGVSRRLRCFDPCCRGNPHAEMVLLVKGQIIGGTTFDRRTQWSSWGPAGDSPGHPTRCAAEGVQLNAHLGPAE